MYRLTILIAISLLAGCGGGGGDEALSREEVEQRAADARMQVERSLDELADARSADELATRLEETADRLRQTADELDEGDAPPEAEPALKRLEDGLERLADQLEDVSGDLSAADLRDLAERLRNLDLNAVEDVQGALEELRERGYDVGRLDA